MQKYKRVAANNAHFWLLITLKMTPLYSHKWHTKTAGIELSIFIKHTYIYFDPCTPSISSSGLILWINCHSYPPTRPKYNFLSISVLVSVLIFWWLKNIHGLKVQFCWLTHNQERISIWGQMHSVCSSFMSLSIAWCIYHSVSWQGLMACGNRDRNVYTSTHVEGSRLVSQQFIVEKTMIQ